MDTLWGLLGQAAALGGVSATRVGLLVSVPLRRRGTAAPSDRSLTLQTGSDPTDSQTGTFLNSTHENFDNKVLDYNVLMWDEAIHTVVTSLPPVFRCSVIQKQRGSLFEGQLPGSPDPEERPAGYSNELKTDVKGDWKQADDVLANLGQADDDIVGVDVTEGGMVTALSPGSKLSSPEVSTSPQSFRLQGWIQDPGQQDKAERCIHGNTGVCTRLQGAAYWRRDGCGRSAAGLPNKLPESRCDHFSPNSQHVSFYAGSFLLPSTMMIDDIVPRAVRVTVEDYLEYGEVMIPDLQRSRVFHLPLLVAAH
ncbi:hypothetical protein EYF80_004268 [Liparis tanakae]|uniref:Uncharacterized protein n=1 Tax=Liparis tanakae TaxID=230148 RepID=A0A4Z2J5G3_9TELE|nr:hypothetical protein EYF80_004268 [Liparis tanakae]